MQSHFTLYELHQFIQRVFYLNFEEEVWIEAEISESRLHNGHYYLTIVEKNEEGGLVAKASGTLWRNKAAVLKNKFDDRFSKLIKSGNKVRILCRVEFHPRYGYSLIIDDFDPDFTEGFLYQERQKTLARLQSEELMDRNHQLPLPEVIKNIAVISSATAAGYQDFMHQLESNAYGYWFRPTLYPSAMQGDHVKDQFPVVMETIASRKDEYDVIIIVRGGGAAIDLSDFDQYEVASSIARSPLPVISGIGHERDLSVADMVAAHRVKTPTAAAEFVIQNNLDYEMAIREIFMDLSREAQKTLHTSRQNIETTRFMIDRYIKSHLQNEKAVLDRQMYAIAEYARSHLHQQHLILSELQSAVARHNPYEVMKRGYAMVFQNEVRVGTLDELDKGEPVTLVMNIQKITLNEK